MIKILLVEDDKDLNTTVRIVLEENGYDVTPCFDGVQALKKFEDISFDIVISDIMMPNMDGYELAKEIRGIDTQIPILFMTAKDDIYSKEKGFKIGIDDYIVKPFDLQELVIRIGAILRRLQIKNSSVIEIGNFVMNEEEHTALIDGEEIALTVREFDILFKLLSFPKKTFTRAKLMELFWDYDSSATSRTVDVYMSKLREKTSKCDGFEIVTIHGLGYKVVLKWAKNLQKENMIL